MRAVLKGLSSRKVVRNCLRPHLHITYAATVPAYAWRFKYFAYAPAYADLRISGLYLHLPSCYIRGGFIAWLTWAWVQPRCNCPTWIKLDHQIPGGDMSCQQNIDKTACLWSIVEDLTWISSGWNPKSIASAADVESYISTQKRSRMRAIHVTLVPLERLVISFNPQFV